MTTQEIVLNGKMTKADLFEQAHRDPEFKRLLLKDPGPVAEKCGVSLEEPEIEALKKLSVLVEFGDDIVFGRLFPPPPPGYPVEIWKVQELLDIFTSLIAEGLPTIGSFSNMTADGADESTTMVIHPPRWVFYPPSWRIFLKDRLVAALRIKQSQVIR